MRRSYRRQKGRSSRRLRTDRTRSGAERSSVEGLVLSLAVLAACGGCAPSPSDIAPSGPGESVDADSGGDPLLTLTTEIPFEHDTGAEGAFYFPEIGGSGGGWVDFDGDGDLDLYAVQAGSVEEAYRNQGRQPHGPSDRLLRNDLVLGSEGSVESRWVDVTLRAGLSDATGYGMGVAVGDFDADGRLDLYVTNAGPNQLWRNRGDGTFEDVTERAGVGEERWSTSATFFDYDGDGRLDLFVANYVDFRLETHRDCRATSGALDYCGPLSYNPEPDRLYRNRGDGSFEDVTVRAGLSEKRGSGLGTVAADFDTDGWPDLFVANDQMVNFLWRNDGDGTFSEEAALAGVAVNMEGDEEASMGVVAADFDEDGALDLFMTHLDGETHTLYRGDGRGLFVDRTAALGLAAPTLPATGFGTAAVDVDLDGWRDLYVANGAVFIIESRRLAGDPFPFRQPDQLFLNRGGAGFESVAEPAGEVSPETGRGVAAGDLWRSGRTSLVVFNSGAAPWRLRPRIAGRWLGVVPLAGGARSLEGASVSLELDGGTRRHARFHRDGSYASANDAAVLIGLGTASPKRLSIERPGAASLDILEPPQGRYLVVPPG